MKPEVLEQIEELLDILREHVAAGIPIVVEGPRDEKALRELEIDGRIFHISRAKKSILNFLEDLATHKQIIILTDFDRRGDELAKFCATHLKHLGSESLLEIRDKLKVLLHKDVKDVQGLANFIRATKAKTQR